MTKLHERFKNSTLPQISALILLGAVTNGAAAPTGYVTQKIQLGAPTIGLAYDDSGVLFALLEPGFGNNVATLRSILPDGSFGPSGTVVGDDPNNLFVGGMTYDPLGDRILITDNTADGRIYVIGANGTQTTIATGLLAIAGIAVRNTGEIFASTALGPAAGGVYMIDRSNGSATPVLGGLDYGSGLAFDLTGNLIVQDAAAMDPFLGRLQRLPLTDSPGGLVVGTPQPVLNGATAAAGVLVDDEGDVFITGSGGIYEVIGSPAGASVFYTSGNPNQFATAIAISPGSGAFEPFVGGEKRVVAMADYGFGVEEPFVTTFRPADPEDFNSDGVVDGADLSLWESHVGQAASSPEVGDADGDGFVTGSDLLQWQRAVGNTVLLSTPPGLASIPEPSAIALIMIALNCGLLVARRT